MSLLKPNLESRLYAEWRLCLGRVVNLCFWSLRLKFRLNSASLAGTISIERIDVNRINSRARMGLGSQARARLSVKPNKAQILTCTIIELVNMSLRVNYS